MSNRINYRMAGIIAGVVIVGVLAVVWASGLLLERNGALPANALIVYNALVLALVVGELKMLSYLRSRFLALDIASLGVLLVALTFCGAFLNSVDRFGKIQLFAWRCLCITRFS